MADMFGSPIGVIASDENYRRNVLSDLDSAGKLNELSLFPLKKREQEIKVDKAETELRHEKQFEQILASTAEGQPVDIPGRLDQLASATAKAGLINKATDLTKAAAEIRAKEAQTAASGATKRLNELKLVQQNAELMGQILGGATDDSSWQMANSLYAMQTGQPSPFAGLPYSPELVQRLTDASLSAKEKAQVEGNRLTREATEAYRKAMLGNSAAARETARDRFELEKERERRLAKGGGGTTMPGSPSEEERTEVKRQLRLSGVDLTGMNSDSVNSTAYSVASRARELQAANKGLGRAQALSQAIEEAQQSGELEVVTAGAGKIPYTDIEVGGTKRFAGKKAKTKAITQALPADRNSLKAGVIYNTARGPAKYLGNGRFATVE